MLINYAQLFGYTYVIVEKNFEICSHFERVPKFLIDNVFLQDTNCDHDENRYMYTNEMCIHMYT